MIEIGAKELTLTEVESILYGAEEINIAASALQKCEKAFYFLKDFAADKVIYGINTGFGPMAQHKIPYVDRLTLQYNLIRSHASGSGGPLEQLLCKAALLDRLNTFAQGKSGVHPDLLLLITRLLNLDIIPVIYEHGGVGASGDLVQLAHVALALIGEGEVYYQGKISPAAEVFARHNITPFAIRLREGIGLINGTSCMTGIGLINLIKAKQLLGWCIILSATINEIFEAFDDHIAAPLNAAKLHHGQNKVAAAMRQLVNGSTLLKSRKEYLYYDVQETHFKDKVQEYYSLRCMPQILGPVYDTIMYAEKIVTDELNSVSDNPIIDYEAENIFHGGNFHGDYVALEMDKLKIAITKLSLLSERQLNYLLNDKLNGKLPPFINTGTAGLNFGMQGVQYTATSTVAENQSLSNSVYVHSIPNNNDNQDIVSMGSNAALITARVIENTFEVLAVQAMAVTDAADALQKADKLSAPLKDFYSRLRLVAPQAQSDIPRFKQLALVKEFLKANNPAVFKREV